MDQQQRDPKSAGRHDGREIDDEPVEDLDPDPELAEQVRGGHARNPLGSKAGAAVKQGWDVSKNVKL